MGQYMVLSGFSTLDVSACGVSMGIQKDGSAPFVETPPELLPEDSIVPLAGVEEAEDIDPRAGVTEFAAILSASVNDLVTFLYLL
jgi:hypothetical protein